MSKLNSILGIYATYALALCSDNQNNDIDFFEEKKESEFEKQKRLEESKKKILKSQGLKEFTYGNNSLWALNKKSADKKAIKMNWL